MFRKTTFRSATASEINRTSRPDVLGQAPPQREVTAETLAPIERLGMLVVMHSTGAERLPLLAGRFGGEGAVGHTLTQVHLEGELFDGESGSLKTTFPREKPGNVLLIPRDQLIDTGLYIRHKLGGIACMSGNLTRNVMDTLTGQELDGVRYDACVSYTLRGGEQADEATYALRGSPNVVSLRLPKLAQ